MQSDKHPDYGVQNLPCLGYNPPMPVHTVMETVGLTALKIMKANLVGKVYGRTSRGDFLLMGESEIVFLSFERHKGPLTANFSPIPEICQHIQLNDKVVTSQNGLFFPDTGWFLEFPPGNGWTAPQPSGRVLPWDGILTRLKDTAAALLTEKGPGIISANLADWLKLDEICTHPGRVHLNRYNFREDIANRDLTALAERLSAIAGLGSGLTPSGDDLIMGFVLTDRRWGKYLPVSFDFSAMLPALYAVLDRKTTLLSRSLVKTAGDGQADERIITALDDVISGDRDPSETICSLASWGSHSGLDVLTGAALYLLCCMPDQELGESPHPERLRSRPVLL